jgi:2',3'-cyclic-nucleotide 2'-phosphodiesterase/3'-nucleotidase
LLWKVLESVPASGSASDVTASPALIDPSAIPAAPASLIAPAHALTLRLIATTDLHASLLPYDYHANRPVTGRSLSTIANQIAQARSEVPNSLLFDNGDFLQGNPLAEYIARSPRRRRTHPVIAAFNALGYDAATLGNHEFNYGIHFLSTALARAEFPVVSANITTRLGKSPLRDKTLVPPFALLKRQLIDGMGRAHTVRIGVIGFAPPQIEVWDQDHLGGRIRMRDIIAAARAWLPRIRASGADIIVALAHCGIGEIEAEHGTENAATALAALPEIDAVIAGHSHMAFPGPEIAAAAGVDPALGLLAGKPAVMPGHSGSHIGIIDLVLTRGGQGRRRWTVEAFRSSLRARSDQAEVRSRNLRQTVGPDHRAALAWSRQQLGTSRVPLHTYFATTAPSAALDLIAEAKAAHVRSRLVGTEWADLPILATASPFRSGGRGGPENFTDIPAGPIRLRNVSDLYSFPNTLVALQLTGADLSDWLEQSAALFRQVSPGSVDAPLHDAARPAFSFDVVPGIAFAVDLSQPPRFDLSGRIMNPGLQRIVGLSLDGQPLDPARRLVLVTNSHRASLANAARDGNPLPVVLSEGTRAQDILANHVRRFSPVGTPPRPGWRFLPMPGTTVTLRSGSGSLPHLGDLLPYRPEPLGTDAEGFRLYRLHL